MSVRRSVVYVSPPATTAIQASRDVAANTNAFIARRSSRECWRRGTVYPAGGARVEMRSLLTFKKPLNSVR